MWSIIILAICLLWPPTAMAVNPVYVATTGNNSYSCKSAESQLKPKRTINGAIVCITTPGGIIYIKPGTYVEELDTLARPIIGGNGPSYTSATRIEGIGTGTVIIQSPIATSGTTLWVHHPNDKFLVFKNLTFDAAGRAGTAVMVYGPAHHIRFDHVKIRRAVSNDNVVIMGASNVELLDTTITEGVSNGVGLMGIISGFLCRRCHMTMNGGKGISIHKGAKTDISLMETDISR